MLTPTVTPMPHAGPSPYAPTDDPRLAAAARAAVAAFTFDPDPDLDRCLTPNGAKYA